MSTPPVEQRVRSPLAEVAYSEKDFPALRLARSSRLARRVGRVLLALLVIAVILMFVAPWQQSIRGAGSVIAFDPVNRRQTVQAPVKGTIAEIGPGIAENARVKQGQLVYRIVDQDPNYLTRLREQVANAEEQLRVARDRLERGKDQLTATKRVVAAKEDELASTKAAQREVLAGADAYILMAENKLAAERAAAVAAADTVWQAQLDFDRKKKLSDKGLETGLKYQEADLKLRQAKAKQAMAEQYVKAAENELAGKKSERQAKQQEWQGKIDKVNSELGKTASDLAKVEIDIAKNREEITKMNSELLKLQSQRDRQETQDVVAPRDGYIMRLVAYNKSAIVKQGDPLFEIVPDTEQPAVQIWVSGNDAPLIAPGRHVRLQFEGWPAAQFSGWPSVAVGTFGGSVALVDPTDDGAGKFRVVVTPDPQDRDWPEFPYLRQGVQANGWVLLDQVPLGYEIWRQINGFPPSLRSKSEQFKKSKPPVPKL